MLMLFTPAMTLFVYIMSFMFQNENTVYRWLPALLQVMAELCRQPRCSLLES